MRRIVIDAATFIAWFGEEPEARSLRQEYEAGLLGVLVLSSFVHDVLGEVAARGWPADRIKRLATHLERIGFEFRDPSPQTMAHWLGRDISPARAAYAALAEESERPLVAADPVLRRRAGPVLQT